MNTDSEWRQPVRKVCDIKTKQIQKTRMISSVVGLLNCCNMEGNEQTEKRI